MSYDLAVWYSATLIKSQEAREIYLTLCRGDYGMLLPSEGLTRFIALLTERYPNITTLTESELEASPWSSPLNVSDRHVLMLMSYAWATELVPYIYQLASENGLVCYNPQGDFVLYPPALEAIPHLRLQLENWTIIDDPRPEEIESAIRSLNEEDNSHAVLERTNSKYIQARYTPDAGLVLEYRDGSPDEHYRCVGSLLGANEIVRAFKSYAAGRQEWKTEHEWEKI